MLSLEIKQEILDYVAAHGPCTVRQIVDACDLDKARIERSSAVGKVYGILKTF